MVLRKKYFATYFWLKLSNTIDVITYIDKHYRDFTRTKFVTHTPQVGTIVFKDSHNLPFPISLDLEHDNVIITIDYCVISKARIPVANLSRKPAGKQGLY